MPDVREGLTQDGQAMHKTGSEPFATPPEAAETPARIDPARDTAAQIAAGILDPENSIDLRSGLTKAAAPEEPPAKLEPLDAESQAYIDWAKREVAAEEAELVAGREAIQERAYEAFDDALSLAGTEAEIAQAFADLSAHVSPEELDEQLWTVAAHVLHLDPDDLDDDEGSAVEELSDSLERHMNAVLGLREATATDERMQKLLPLAAAQRVEEMRESIHAWQREQGLTGDEARARLEALDATIIDTYGIGLEQFMSDPNANPEFLGNLLRAADASVMATAEEVAVTDLRSQILNAPTTNVAEGLTVFTPWGFAPLQERPELEISGERIARRASRIARPSTSAAEIKAGVVENDSKTVAEGLTRDGKPVSLDEAMDGPARRAFERELAKRQAWPA